jgi:hypothetical protein
MPSHSRCLREEGAASSQPHLVSSTVVSPARPVGHAWDASHDEPVVSAEDPPTTYSAWMDAGLTLKWSRYSS